MLAACESCTSTRNKIKLGSEGDVEVYGEEGGEGWQMFAR